MDLNVGRRWSLRKRKQVETPSTVPQTTSRKEAATTQRKDDASRSSPSKRRRSTRLVTTAKRPSDRDGDDMTGSEDLETAESGSSARGRYPTRSRSREPLAQDDGDVEDDDDDDESSSNEEAEDADTSGRRYPQRVRKADVKFGQEVEEDDSEEEESEDESAPRQSRRTRRPVVRMNIQALGRGSGSPAVDSRRNEEHGFERQMRRAESRFDARKRQRRGPPVFRGDRIILQPKPRGGRGRGRDYNRRARRDRDEYRHRSFGGNGSSSSDDDSNMARAFGGVAPSPRRGDRRHRSSGSSSAPRAINGGGDAGGDVLRADAAPLEIDKSINWSSIGGLESHIDSLKEMVLLPLLYPEAFTRFGIQPPRGVLFYGPPGTGKTLMARALVNECSVGDKRVSFFMRKGADVLSKWAGEAEKQLRILFDEARKRQPSIIFFDEIDGLAPVRSSKQDQHHSSIVSTLLALMDGLDSRGQVVVIGATNRIDSIDPALRRPGRFDRELAFNLPTRAARESILGIATKAWTPPLSSLFKKELARQTVGYCGADIKSLCSEAAIGALRRSFPLIYKSTEKLVIDPASVRVTIADFTTAMAAVTPASQRNASTFAAPLSSSSPKYKVLSAALAQFTECLAKEARGLAPASELESAASSSSASSSSSSSSSSASSSSAAVETASVGATSSSLPPSELALAALEEADPEDPLLLAAIYEEPTSTADEARMLESVRRVFRQGASGSGTSAKVVHSRRRQTRAVFCGDPGNGQEALAAAVLHSLEDLPTFPLDLPGLIADAAHPNAAEACIMRMRSAQRSAPSVVYLPFAAAWWMEAGEAMRSALRMALRAVPASCPLIFLASADLPFDEMDATLRDLLIPCQQRSGPFALLDEVVQHVHHLSAPTFEDRSAIFAPLEERLVEVWTVDPIATATVDSDGIETRERILARRTTRETAPLVVAALPAPVARVTDPAELKQIRKAEEQTLRELRIILRRCLRTLCKERRFVLFVEPVDEEEVPDYREIIATPMCLEYMMEKVDDAEYDSLEAFMSDLDLIANNAKAYNPMNAQDGAARQWAKSEFKRGRKIISNAIDMQDVASAFVANCEDQLGYQLFAKCREIEAARAGHVLAQRNSSTPRDSLASITVDRNPPKSAVRFAPVAEEEEDIEWQTSGHRFIGQRVCRSFDGEPPIFEKRLAHGVITKWAPESEPGLKDDLWHMTHDDGDREDLEEYEVVAAIAEEGRCGNNSREARLARRRIVNSTRLANRNDAEEEEEEEEEEDGMDEEETTTVAAAAAAAVASQEEEEEEPEQATRPRTDVYSWPYVLDASIDEDTVRERVSPMISEIVRSMDGL